MIESDPYTRRPRHGFYIYRNNRIIVSAERFHGVIPSAVQLWAFRGRLMFDETADRILSLDVKKRRLQLPQKVRANLQNLIRNHITKSREAWEQSGRRVQKEKGEAKEDFANVSISESPVVQLDYTPGQDISDASARKAREQRLEEIKHSTPANIQDEKVTPNLLKESVSNRIFVTPSRGLRANAMWLAYPSTELGLANTVVNEAHSWVSEAYTAAEDESRITVILHQLFTILSRAELEVRSTKWPNLDHQQVDFVIEKFKSRASIIAEDLADSLKLELERLAGEYENADAE